MKIGYFGDGPWAHQALDRIRRRTGRRVEFVVARHPKPDPVLRAEAKSMGAPFYSPKNVNEPGFVRLIREHSVDINVSMSFDQIMHPEIIGAAPMGFINCHAGALPFYRGRNVLNWVLINGESSFGVTVHYIDVGIDTGDIIIQRMEPIGPNDTYPDLLQRAYPLCAEALDQALCLLERGDAPRRKQNEIDQVGMYCRRRKTGDEALDWSWSSQRLHNFIRGITRPGPGARCGNLAILRSMMPTGHIQYAAAPGEVIDRTPQGNLVRTGDGALFVTSVARVGRDGALGSSFVPNFLPGMLLVAATEQQLL